MEISRRSFTCSILMLSFFRINLKAQLKGSKAIQEQQNARIDVENLTRIQDDQELDFFIKAGFLTPLPDNDNITIDDKLEKKRWYCRPWTREWLLQLGEDYRKAFPKGDPLVVTSAIRTVLDQVALRRINSNAAPASGPRASAHLTGSTVDITKKDMSPKERAWLRSYLIKFKKQGRGIVIEEFSQAVFHVMVFKP